MRNKLFLTGFVFLLLVLPLVSSAVWYDYPSLETNLEGFWNFDDAGSTFADSVAGEYLENQMLTNQQAGQINYSAEGIGWMPSYADSHNNLHYDYNQTTYCAWVYFTSGSGGAMFGDKSTRTYGDVFFRWDGTNVFANTGGGEVTSPAINTNEWNFYCVVGDGITTELFFNGTSQGTNADGINSSGLTNTEGIIVNNDNNIFGGSDARYDDLMIWSRALNSTEIDWVYQLGASGKSREEAPIVCSVLTTGNYTISGGKIIASDGSEYLGTDVNVTYDYSYNQNTQAGNVIDDTTKSIAGVTDWFPIIVVISAMIVLIILTILILNAIRGSGMVTSA